MISGGKWAPLKLIAIVVLPHDARLVMEGDHTANGLKCKFATKPSKLDTIAYVISPKMPESPLDGLTPQAFAAQYSQQSLREAA
jgi:hypothetical protein